VEEGKLRLVLILDSYDELKKEYIGKNLYHTNRLDKWRRK